MTMRRALVERIGLFDENFGSGAFTPMGGDTEYSYRAYVAGDVTDITVFHFHVRKTRETGYKLGDMCSSTRTFAARSTGTARTS